MITDLTPLSELAPGEAGTVMEVHLDGLMKRRLIDMGVTAGTAVKTLRTAPMGDPSEYHILGYNLSLRKNEAKKIFIIKDGGQNG